MPLNFPNSPAVDQVHTEGQKSWRWTGTVWNLIASGFGAAASSSFTTVAVAGQNNVVADSVNDTITLVAGQGITITTSASTDAVTITSVATTGNITIVNETIDTNNSNPITITPNLLLGGSIRFPDDTVQTTATLVGPEGPAGPTGSGAGDVVSIGGGYTDNAIIRYNGTTGTSIQTSTASISDAGLLAATAFSGNGAAVTALNAANLASGTVPDARFPATLPAASGVNLTALNATNLGSGTVPVARLGTAGTRDATTYLRGDNTWATIAGGGSGTVTSVGGTGTVNGITLTGTVTASGNLTLGGTLSNVGLTSQVTGILPVANGGSGTDTPGLVQGTNVTISGTWPNQTINSTAAGGATTFTGLTDVSAASLTVDQIYLPAITMLNTTNNGASAYRFDQYGTADNPTIYAINGATIAFNLNVAGHPFLIQTSGGSNYDTGLTHVTTGGTVTTGSSAQGKTSGTLYWKIPSAISGNYRYICSIHGAMVGSITIKNFASI
jgi:plastocyanin